MNTYTVFVREANGTGTTYIASADATTPEEAAAKVLAMCAEDWGHGYTVDDLHVLGVALGDIQIIEWDDEL